MTATTSTGTYGRGIVGTGKAVHEILISESGTVCGTTCGSGVARNRKSSPVHRVDSTEHAITCKSCITLVTKAGRPVGALAAPKAKPVRKAKVAKVTKSTKAVKLVRRGTLNHARDCQHAQTPAARRACRELHWVAQGRGKVNGRIPVATKPAKAAKATAAKATAKAA